MPSDLPLCVLAGTVCFYWSTVVALAVYKRLRYRESAGVVPRRRFERRLWIFVLLVVGCWIAVPLAAATLQPRWLMPPAWVGESSVLRSVRWAAASVGIAAYFLSLYCWLVMGRNWSMAVVPRQKSQLVTTGLYRWVRHPIYSLSILLMLATVVVLPTWRMALVALVHLVVMNLKARYEEHYLAESFGSSYQSYCRNVGRFWPRAQSMVQESADR